METRGRKYKAPEIFQVLITALTCSEHDFAHAGLRVHIPRWGGDNYGGAHLRPNPHQQHHQETRHIHARARKKTEALTRIIIMIYIYITTTTTTIIKKKIIMIIIIIIIIIKFIIIINIIIINTYSMYH